MPNTIKKYTKKEAEAANPQRAKNKRIIITVFLVLIGFIAFYCIAAVIIGRLSQGDAEETVSYKFSAIIENENIEEDAVYMDLDRNFYFEEPDYGTTVSITPDSPTELASSYYAPVKTVCSYIRAAIAGDTPALNALFSVKYLKNGGETKSSFTAQKIYNILISIQSQEDITESGSVYTSYVFGVDYMIRKNNGTFRKDMGSDCIRREYFTVTVREGIGQIDAISTVKPVSAE